MTQILHDTPYIINFDNARGDNTYTHVISASVQANNIISFLKFHLLYIYLIIISVFVIFTVKLMILLTVSIIVNEYVTE